MFLNVLFSRLFRAFTTRVLAVACMLLGGLVSADAAPAEQQPVAEAAITPAQIEADFLRQNEVRTQAPAGNNVGKHVKPESDAVGAVDGHKDGKWGFHTEHEEDPWWQVDLGRPTKLDHSLLFNRCDGTAGRIARLMVLVSDNAKEWKQVFQNDGTTFYGFSDKKPLKVPLNDVSARYIRLQLPGKAYFHLDEVEVYAAADPTKNIALGKPATQSSSSTWSVEHPPVDETPQVVYQTAEAVQRGLALAENLRAAGAAVDDQIALLRGAAERLKQLPDGASEEQRRKLYLAVRWAVRRMALANPLLDFNDLLIVKRAPTLYSHMSDQYYGWWSQPGGGLYVLKNFKSPEARLACLTPELPPGSVLRPDLSYDGKRVLFAWCKHYPGLSKEANKMDKANVPEDAFYHLFEINIDGTGLRQLTFGKYDDFDGRYLPDGRIVFLSTRRGRYVQCTHETGCKSLEDPALPDSYVRCGGGPSRPVAVYTLHVMDAEGKSIRQISSFENFEWTPSVDHDGRILFARWDYVDRHNNPYMSLWSTMPDGTNLQAVYGNMTRIPQCFFEARPVPNSNKLLLTGSAHHSITGGSLVLLDLAKGVDGEEPMTRLTPEVCFPELEGWPATYYANPYPLSEDHYLVAWSDQPLRRQGQQNTRAALGTYLYDRWGNLNLICRDQQLGCVTPIPIRPRPRPPVIPEMVAWAGQQSGKMLMLDVHEGLDVAADQTPQTLRVIGIPAKTHPTMHNPPLGLTREDPGKFILGEVPIERDGSAYFHLPSGIPFFMQVLDNEGMAIQTMRSAMHVQPGQSYTCVGCHEPRNTAPPNVNPMALRRPASKLAAGPEGTWPLDYQKLVQPVLEKNCVSCHKPGGEDADFELTAGKSYHALTTYGKPSLADHVNQRAREGRSTAGACVARESALLKLLDAGHHGVKLSAEDRRRLITWMDVYAQLRGSFDEAQEAEITELREKMAPILAP